MRVGDATEGASDLESDKARLQVWLYHSRVQSLASSFFSSSDSHLKGHLLREAHPDALIKIEPIRSLSNHYLVLFFSKAVLAT